MYELKLAYYKGKQSDPKKRIVTAIIKLFTGKYSHVELVFPSDLFADKNCFSSSGWDNGVRYKKINFSHPERWQFQKLGEFSKERIKCLRDCCDKYIGKKYATLDVIRRFGLGKKANSPDKFWCSEACIRVLNDWKLFDNPVSENLAPTRMFYRFKRLLDE